MSLKYELRFKTKGYPWKVFDTYNTIDCPEMMKHYNVYKKAKIIEDVEVIEIKTTRRKTAL